MRFGGHETFSIRDGWLHKGLRMVVEDPSRLFDEHAGDWLGVGRNMAKSIRYWLLATGLAERNPDEMVGKTRILRPTKFGELVHERDQYLSEIGTWWAIHVNLVNCPDQALTWSWFFNSFNAARFERSVCVESLRRFVRLTEKRMPSPRTLDRDVTCLLRSYARPIPLEAEDPEEALDCPLAELGLVTHFRASGYYQVNQIPKDVPPHLLGYSLALTYPEHMKGSRTADIPLSDAARDAGGPARVFALTSESLFEAANRAEAKLRQGAIQIAGLAGSRMIRLKQWPAIRWLKQYYTDIAKKGRHAA